MKKTLSEQGLGLVNGLLAILSLATICISIYLIKHFFDANFPESLDASSTLCSISMFLNCDSATFSPLAHFFGMPTGVFGFIFGICIFIGAFSSSEKLEQQNKLLALVNGFGCLFFLAYSLFFLKSLCPFCTLYYLLSWIILFVYLKKSSLKPVISWTHAAWQVAILAAFGTLFSYNYNNSKNHQGKISEKIIQEYERLADLGLPQVDSTYFIHRAIIEPKVTINIFSDFQCPFCKKISDQMHDISRRFKDYLQINYYFFPLDPSCNSEVKNNIHSLACYAAEIASCQQDKFLAVHDAIFATQENLADQVFADIRKKFDLNNCPSKEEFLTMMESHIKVAKQYNVRSTPTFILNGRKIEGLVPTNHLAALIEHLIQKSRDSHAN